MLADTSPGNPAVVARPIPGRRPYRSSLGRAERRFRDRPAALGLGIAWRPTVRLALGASVVWALRVWWLGEGLGSLLSCEREPRRRRSRRGHPYALLAVLLWPGRRDRRRAVRRPAGPWAGVSPGGCGWCCGRAWPSSAVQPALPGAAGRQRHVRRDGGRAARLAGLDRPATPRDARREPGAWPPRSLFSRSR